MNRRGLRRGEISGWELVGLLTVLLCGWAFWRFRDSDIGYRKYCNYCGGDGYIGEKDIDHAIREGLPNALQWKKGYCPQCQPMRALEAQRYVPMTAGNVPALPAPPPPGSSSGSSPGRVDAADYQRFRQTSLQQQRLTLQYRIRELEGQYTQLETLQWYHPYDTGAQRPSQQWRAKQERTRRELVQCYRQMAASYQSEDPSKSYWYLQAAQKLESVPVR